VADARVNFGRCRSVAGPLPGFSTLLAQMLALTLVAIAVEAGCSSTPPRPVEAPASRAAAIGFPDDLAPLPRYHSKRFAVSVPLPDGHRWRIDDHSHPELVATHESTRSRLVVAVFHADELVGRTQCEALSRARKLVPTGDLRTLEDEATVTQETFDTRVWVAIEPGIGPDRSLAGYVLAFGGFLRKCFTFVFSTQVDNASDEPVLSSRLAFARSRILGGLELDAFGSVPRDLPVAPGAGQPH
jgi:hypothetical protein